MRHVVRKEAEVRAWGREIGKRKGAREGKRGREEGNERAGGRSLFWRSREPVGPLKWSEREVLRRVSGRGEVPASRGVSGPSPFSFFLRIDVLLLTREEAAAAEDGVAESVNPAPLLGSGAGR